MARACKVLIVEDEPLIAMMLEDYLLSAGHAVAGTAENVREASALVEAGGFDMAILDVNLDRELVWPVADLLTRRQIPFVVATGGGDDGIPAEHATAPRLNKPYSIDELTGAIESICELI